MSSSFISLLICAPIYSAPIYEIQNRQVIYRKAGIDCITESYQDWVHTHSKCIRYNGKPANTLNASLYLACSLKREYSDNKSYDEAFNVAILPRQKVISKASFLTRNDYKANITNIKEGMLITWNGVKFQKDKRYIIRPINSDNFYSHIYEEIKISDKNDYVMDDMDGTDREFKFDGKKWTEFYKKLPKTKLGKGKCYSLSRREFINQRHGIPLLIK